MKEYSCHYCTECVDNVLLNHVFRFNKSFAWGKRSQGQPQTAQWLTGLQTQPVPDQPEPSWWRNHHDGEQCSRVHHTHQQERSSEFLGYTGIISISAVISDSCGEDCHTVVASSGFTAVSFCFLCLTCKCSLLLLQSKPESSELVSPKTTDDIVQEKGEEGQRAARRRHKTENVKQQWSQDKAMAVELEQAQRCVRTEAAWSSALTYFGQNATGNQELWVFFVL